MKPWHKWFRKGGAQEMALPPFLIDWYNTREGVIDMTTEKGLTEKQKRFADFYIECGSGAEAARLAGYSKRSARGIATENLAKPAVKKYIEERIASKDAKRIARQDEILKFLTSVMRGEVREQIPLLDGDGMQRLADLDETSPKDRIKAAELLGKRYALWTDKREIEGQIGVVIVDDTGMDDEEE